MREKAWWLALALAAAGCAANRPFADSIVKTADLPVAGTVGDFPPASNRLLIELSPGHPMLVDGKPMSAPALGRALKQINGSRHTGQDGPSDVAILIRADRAVDWGFVAAALARCAEQNGARVFYAVRSQADGEEGALALFLPCDRGVCSSAADNPEKWRQFEVAFAATPDAVRHPSSLYARLHGLPRAARRHTVLVLKVPSRFPTGEVLLACDLACRAGVRCITFLGIPESGLRFFRDDNPSPIADAVTAPEGVGLVFPQELEPAKTTVATPPVPPRITGGYSGITEILNQILEVEVEPPPEK